MFTLLILLSVSLSPCLYSQNHSRIEEGLQTLNLYNKESKDWRNPPLLKCQDKNAKVVGCKQTSTPLPPFMLSHHKGDWNTKRDEGITDNELYFAKGSTITKGTSFKEFRSNQNNKDKRRIPVGSLVKVSGYPHLVEKQNWVKSEVISTQDTASSYAKAGAHDFVKRGDTGYIYSGSLKEAGDSLYTVTKESDFINFPQLKEKPDVIEPLFSTKYSANANKNVKFYKALKCGNELFYFFQGLKSGKVVSEPFITDTACIARAVDEKTFLYFDKFRDLIGKDLPVEDFKFTHEGFFQLPQVEVKGIANIPTQSHNGSFVHYQGSDPSGSDTWAKPETVCSFLSLANKWKNSCQNNYPGKQCQIMVGDFAFPARGKTASNRCPLGHGSHDKGTCFDMRPFRNDKQLIGTHYSASNHKMTQSFINLAKSMGADKIIYNDKRINGVSRYKGHDNHLHICFNQGSKGC